MKSYIFIPILVAAFIIAMVIYTYMLPDFIKLGGYLVPFLITLSILLFTFIGERLFTIRRAQGRSDVGRFTRNLKKAVDAGELDAAIDVCRKQGGSIANVVGAGLERYHGLSDSTMTNDEKIEETKRAIEEANALEIPLLERNLIALSTIASISTMVGLLGTTVGMIRSFRAMGHAGAPDAIQLAIGISEALINTAGGLFIAIIGIVVYNAFTNRIDSFNFMMDEITYEVVQLLERKKR
ncbi:MAG: MotA/TolQ/ExbB proton channel family protein [Candidatus Eisenbacteria bacterium]|nr:MotA/TolQ/ExbB proton channel family protein [Candidatus Eisenbacteria bacterium]